MEKAVLEFRRSGHFDALRSQILADFNGSEEEAHLKELIRGVMEAEAVNHPVLLTGDQADSLSFIEKRVQKELSLLGSSASRLPDFVDKFIKESTTSVGPKIEKFLTPTSKHAQTRRPTHPPSFSHRQGELPASSRPSSHDNGNDNDTNNDDGHDSTHTSTNEPRISLSNGSSINGTTTSSNSHGSNENHRYSSGGSHNGNGHNGSKRSSINNGHTLSPAGVHKTTRPAKRQDREPPRRRW